MSHLYKTEGQAMRVWRKGEILLVQLRNVVKENFDIIHTVSFIGVQLH